MKRSFLTSLIILMTLLQISVAQKINTQNLKGNVLLINFFATWCGPCMAEMPHLEKEIWRKKELSFFMAPDPILLFTQGRIITTNTTIRATQHVDLFQQ